MLCLNRTKRRSRQARRVQLPARTERAAGPACGLAGVDFGHIITTMNNLLALIVLGLALMVGAVTTIEVMTLFPDSPAACVNGNC
jgi:hypothetical protein